MRRHYRFIVRAITVGLMASLSAAVMGFENPLDQPSMPSSLAAHSPTLALTNAGGRIVAVGQRGHIILSDDGGQHWQQAVVPVSSDLLAVSFPSPKQGWAVGHGGVVLHSADGGSTWTKQFDGRQAAAIAVRYYEAQLASGLPVEQFLKREKSLTAEGGTQPLLDVFFESDSTGYVVGTFNRIFRTEDGGKHWTPWMDRTENPRELHFYAIRGGANGIYLAGEQGMVWRLDAASQRFVATPTSYKGTLFGLVIDGPNNVLVFGMRGSLYRSEDAGKTWNKIAIGSPAGITGGTVLADGGIVVVNQAGGIDLSRDHGKTFMPVKSAQAMPYFGVAPLANKRIGLAGTEGVRLETIE